MSSQIFYEDVDEGDEIPSLLKRPSTRQLVKWAGAVEDFYEGHYDKDFALTHGLAGVIVHGMLVVAFLAQMLTDWIGSEGTLRKLSCTYRKLLLVNEDIVCRGEITKKIVDEGGKHHLECEVWAENPKAEKAIEGTALLEVPSRSGILRP
jgi:acyl dehydratase